MDRPTQNVTEYLWTAPRVGEPRRRTNLRRRVTFLRELEKTGSVSYSAARAGPALAQPSANVIDVGPPADLAAVVVLRGSSAPPQPWGGPPAPQTQSAPQPPAPAYLEQAYVPLYVMPGYFRAPPPVAPQAAPPIAPQVAPSYPIRPWGVGLAPFQR